MLFDGSRFLLTKGLLSFLNYIIILGSYYNYIKIDTTKFIFSIYSCLLNNLLWHFSWREPDYMIKTELFLKITNAEIKNSFTKLFIYRICYAWPI